MSQWSWVKPFGEEFSSGKSRPVDGKSRPVERSVGNTTATPVRRSGRDRRQNHRPASEGRPKPPAEAIRL